MDYYPKDQVMLFFKKKIICRTFEGELGLQLIFFKLKMSFNQEEEGKLLVRPHS